MGHARAIGQPSLRYCLKPTPIPPMDINEWKFYRNNLLIYLCGDVTAEGMFEMTHIEREGIILEVERVNRVIDNLRYKAGAERVRQKKLQRRREVRKAKQEDLSRAA